MGPCVGIARASLQQVLVRGASAVPCRLGTAVTSLAQHGRQVAVTFTDGSSVQFWLGDGCFFGLCAVGDGHTYGFGNVTHPRERDPAGDHCRRA